jgi:hypothetical protein
MALLFLPAAIHAGAVSQLSQTEEQSHMNTQLDMLLAQIKNDPARVEFQSVMTTIAEFYDYTPTQFSNGLDDDRIINHAGENEGSCKIFAFAQLHSLTEHETLACFGQYYRHDVLQHPQATDHLNIRTFMRHGWSGIQFENPPLTLRKPA